jgi:hypothetical protein
MHQLILRTKYIDHIDGNGLNNTRGNLRIATTKQNTWNRKKRTIPTSSKYKGVSVIKGRDRWQCRIYANGTRFFLGYFASEIEAARAYDKKAIELFGEFARLNFPICTERKVEE